MKCVNLCKFHYPTHPYLQISIDISFHSLRLEYARVRVCVCAEPSIFFNLSFHELCLCNVSALPFSEFILASKFVSIYFFSLTFFVQKAQSF